MVKEVVRLNAFLLWLVLGTKQRTEFHQNISRCQDITYFCQWLHKLLSRMRNTSTKDNKCLRSFFYSGPLYRWLSFFVPNAIISWLHQIILFFIAKKSAFNQWGKDVFTYPTIELHTIFRIRQMSLALIRDQYSRVWHSPPYCWKFF